MDHSKAAGRLGLLLLIIIMPNYCTGQAPSPPASDQSPVFARIMALSSQDSASYDYLTQLGDDIGPRVTGSPGAKRAVQWALSTMQAIGLHNVHEETWQLHQSWQRRYAHAEIVNPISRPLSIASLGWAGSTRGAREAEVVVVDPDAPLERLRNASPAWAGKILFLASTQAGHRDAVSAFARIGPLVSVAALASVVAVVCGDDALESAGLNLLHTGPVSFLPKTYPVPVVDMVREDRQQIERLLKKNGRVRIRIDVRNELSTGPVDSANVIGELPGTDQDNQIVVVGAHLDSWDLATGAVDDGAGVAAALAAAKAIIVANAQPRRTIRFILFTGEEQGIRGSRAYALRHEKELDRHVCSLILDLGQGPINGLQLAGRPELLPVLAPFTERIKEFAPLELSDTSVLFTDAYAFTLAGVPGITFKQDSPGYAMIRHSSADTVDKVDPEILRRNAGIVAISAFWMADYPLPLHTKLSKEKVREMISVKQSELLELLGMWPPQ